MCINNDSLLYATLLDTIVTYKLSPPSTPNLQYNLRTPLRGDFYEYLSVEDTVLFAATNGDFRTFNAASIDTLYEISNLIDSHELAGIGSIWDAFFDFPYLYYTGYLPIPVDSTTYPSPSYDCGRFSCF